MKPLLALMLTLVAGCQRQVAMDSNPTKEAAAPSTVSATSHVPPTVRATVCVLGCGGPHPVDAEGNVYAATYIDVDANDTVSGLSVGELELSNAAGAIVARGTASAALTVVAADNRPMGPFTGTVTKGAHVRLWVSMRLDAREDALTKAPPIHFRLSLVSADGPVTTDGPVTRARATG